MEIHVPDHPVMTWKQFFVHMGIVVLGLLIAVSLEQTVEWFHHRHQRHKLVEDMQDEAEANIKVIETDFKQNQEERRGLSELLLQLRNAPMQNGYIALDITKNFGPQSQVEASTSPSRGTWAVARAAGLIPLLTRDQVRMYTRLDFEAEQELKAEDETNLKYNAMIAMLHVRRAPDGSPFHLLFTPAERDEFIQRIEEYITADEWMMQRLSFWKGASEGLLKGAKTEEELMVYVEEGAKQTGN